MSEDRLDVYLDRMEAAVSRALGYVDNMEKSIFYRDQRTQDAIIANIAAIGECVIKIMDLFPTFVADHPEIPWRDIRAMRNRVAHQYFDMDVDTVWLTVKIKMPELLRDLNRMGRRRDRDE